MDKPRRPRHDLRDDNNQHFAKSPACDACGKPTGTVYYTDTDVCGNTDGPGFFLCDRKRCRSRREGLSVAKRAALYIACRCKTDMEKQCQARDFLVRTLAVRQPTDAEVEQLLNEWKLA